VTPYDGRMDPFEAISRPTSKKTPDVIAFHPTTGGAGNTTYATPAGIAPVRGGNISSVLRRCLELLPGYPPGLAAVDSTKHVVSQIDGLQRAILHSPRILKAA